MKIKVKDKSFDEVMNMPAFKNKRPEPQGGFWRWLLKTASKKDLKKVDFSLNKRDLAGLDDKEPVLFLMNHSSFIDLEIASTVIYPRPFHIVCTLDGFVGKEWLMRKIGCIPTRKFMADTALVRDMIHTAKDLKESILLYPEASYTFDGTATPLPDSLGKAVKLLGIPVVMIRTYGAFLRDPLYNNLQLRNIKVTADMDVVLSKEDIESKSVREINEIIGERFSFDNFRWQKELGVKVTEPFRADSLERVLYKCPCCGREDSMKGKGTKLTCSNCGKEYELTELGEMQALEGKTEFSHIPDWYRWERESVRKEIEAGTYNMESAVDIIALVNTDAVYRIGEGVLRHTVEGFSLKGCDGKLDFSLSPEESYSLYADYFWYELGDIVSIGTPKIQYYCFPKTSGNAAGKDAVGGDAAGEEIAAGSDAAGFNVAKARLAAEELYKYKRRKSNV